MATKTSRQASAQDAAASALSPLHMISEVARQQVSMMTEATCAVLGSSEALGRIQQQAVHQAAVRHQAAAETLRGDVEPLDVLALQSDLLRQDMQEAAQYWAQLASTAMKTQLDMVGRMTEMLNSGSQGGLTTAMDAWRNAVAASGDSSARRSDLH
jgi:aspartate aminotransferase-like enzyme